jgi:predicted ATPase
MICFLPGNAALRTDCRCRYVAAGHSADAAAAYSAAAAHFSTACATEAAAAAEEDASAARAQAALDALRAAAQARERAAESFVFRRMRAKAERAYTEAAEFFRAGGDTPSAERADERARCVRDRSVELERIAASFSA